LKRFELLKSLFVSQYVFTGMKELSRLDLRKNHLRALKQTTFKELSNLRYLLLAENRICCLQAGVFLDLEKLMYLVLSGNPLGEDETSTTLLSFNSSLLSYMDLSECHLKRIPRRLPNSLRYLQLRRNNLTFIERDAFVDCPNVSILVLDENAISVVEDGAFEGLGNLQQLWLNYNRLERIPSALPSGLRRLLVESNMLRAVTADAFPTGSKLDTISLAGNQISTLHPDALNELTNLQSIDLSNNKLRQISGQTFANNSQLKTLQLSRNPLEDFQPGCFGQLTSLKKLSLAYIPNSSLPALDKDLFQDLSSLTQLDLDSSPSVVHAVVDSDDLLSSLANLRDLSLRNSHLMTIRSDFLDFFPNLAVLHASGNRWHCDVELTWLRDWLMTAIRSVTFRPEDSVCFTPLRLRDHTIVSLADSEFDPSSDSDSSEFAGKNIDNQRRVTGTPQQSATYSSRKADAVLSPSTFKPSSPKPSPSKDEVKNIQTEPTFAKHFHRTKQPDLFKDLWNIERHVDPLDISSWVRDNAYTSLPMAFPSTSPGATLGNKSRKNAFLTRLSFSSNTSSGQSTPSVPQQQLNAASERRHRVVITSVVVTVIVTTIIVVIIVILIVRLTNPRSREDGGTVTRVQKINSVPPSTSKLIVTAEVSKLDRNYFLAKSLRGDNAEELGCTPPPDENALDVVVPKSMTLIPGRDINHEGPLRVYKWTDF